MKEMVMKWLRVRDLWLSHKLQIERETTLCTQKKSNHTNVLARLGHTFYYLKNSK
jgi:hypothetical protein